MQLFISVTSYVMLVLPADTPVTIPVLLFIVATPVFEECQTMVPIALVVNVVVSPTQTLFVPVMTGVAGSAFTVTFTVDVLLQVPLLAVTV